MKTQVRATRLPCVLFFAAASIVLGAEEPSDPSPQPPERQLPHAMHSAMTQLPRITVGRADADVIGTDNRALQAAVDYIAGLGGGTVEIGTWRVHDAGFAARAVARDGARPGRRNGSAQGGCQRVCSGLGRRFRRGADHG